MGDSSEESSDEQLPYDDGKFWKNWRGILHDLPDDEKLRLLLREQDECQRSKRTKNPELLKCIRKNLPETEQNSPAIDNDEWLWYVYEKALQKEIDSVISKQRNSFWSVRHFRCVQIS